MLLMTLMVLLTGLSCNNMHVHHILNPNLDLPGWYRGMMQHEGEMLVYTLQLYTVMCCDNNN